jgi:hypothetical protein
MESARATWSDDRLDAMSGRVDERFDELSGRVGRLETRMDSRFDRVESRFDSLQQAMIITLAGILAAFASLVAVIKF